MIFLNILLPFVYLITLILYGISFLNPKPKRESIKVYFLYITIVIHSIYLIWRTIEFSHPPITNVFEILTVVAFSLAVAYAYIELKTKVRTTGFFILIAVVIFQILSSLFIKDLLNVPEVLRSNLLGFHVVSALIGFSAITISAVYGLLYLMLYHEIKTTRFGTIYQRLPNLEILEQMNFTATVLGFIFLTIAIIIGAIWLPKAFETFSYTDPKLIGTTFIWLLYATGLIANKFVHWRGKKLIWLSITGFIISFFSLTIINIFFSDFHRFY